MDERILICFGYGFSIIECVHEPVKWVHSNLITEQVYDIAQKLFKQGVSFDEEHADWMIANQYVLPPIWHSIARTTDLLIIFPTEYPEVPPMGFYLKEDIPLSVNGHLYHPFVDGKARFPSVEDARYYKFTEEDILFVQSMPFQMIAGTPEQVKGRLMELVTTYDIEELIIVNACPGFQARLRSYQLLAETFHPTPVSLYYENYKEWKEEM